MRKLVYFIREWKLTDGNVSKYEKRKSGQRLRDRATNKPYDPKEDILIKKHENIKERMKKLKIIKKLCALSDKINKTTDAHISFVRGLYPEIKDYINGGIAFCYVYKFFDSYGSDTRFNTIPLYYMDENGEQRLDNDVYIKYKHDDNLYDINNVSKKQLLDDNNHFTVTWNNFKPKYYGNLMADEDDCIIYSLITFSIKSEYNILEKSIERYFKNAIPNIYDENSIKLFRSEISNAFKVSNDDFYTILVTSNGVRDDNIDINKKLSKCLSGIKNIISRY